MEFMWIIFYTFLVMYCGGQTLDADAWSERCGHRIGIPDYPEFLETPIGVCKRMEHHVAHDKLTLSLMAFPIGPHCKCSIFLQSEVLIEINSPGCLTLDHDDCPSDASGCPREQDTDRKTISVVTDKITFDYSSCRKVSVAPVSRPPYCYSTFIEVEPEDGEDIAITVSCGTPVSNRPPIPTDRDKDAGRNDDVKLGIGIGIGLGLTLILASGIFVAWYCKRKNKRSQHENPPGPNSTTNPSYNEAPDVIPHSLHREASGNYTYIEIDKVHKDPSSGAKPPPLPADRTASKYLKLHRMNSESVVVDNKAYEGFDNIASKKREGDKHIESGDKTTSSFLKTHRFDSETEIVDNKAYQWFKSIPSESEKGEESKHIMSENKSTSSSPKIHRLDSETEVIDNKAYQGFESTPSEGQVGKNLVDAKNDDHHSHGTKTLYNVSAADDDKAHPTFERTNHNMEGNSGYSLATANDKSVSNPPERQISDLDLEVVDNVAHPAVVERKTSA